MDGIASKGGGTALSLEQSRVSSIESEARPAQPGQVTGAEPSALAALQHRSPSDEGSLSRRNPPSSWNRLQHRARTHSQQLQHCPGCSRTGAIRAGRGARLCLSEGTFLHGWEVSLVNDNTSFTLIGQELSARL